MPVPLIWMKIINNKQSKPCHANIFDNIKLNLSSGDEKKKNLKIVTYQHQMSVYNLAELKQLFKSWLAQNPVNLIDFIFCLAMYNSE